VSFSKSRLLLDTTYLLPIVGVDVEGVEKILTILEELYRSKAVEVYYTPFNLLEIIGKISKLEYDEERVRAGLIAIKSRFKLATPTARGYVEALKLRRRGFRDLVDLLLYTTSKTRKLLFLTRDYALVDFLKSEGQDTSSIILEEDFVKMHTS